MLVAVLSVSFEFGNCFQVPWIRPSPFSARRRRVQKPIDPVWASCTNDSTGVVALLGLTASRCPIGAETAFALARSS